MTDFPQFIKNVKIKRPHVFILGAGASYAAFSNGDKHGRRLPLMSNLVEILSLEPLLNTYGINYSGENFEELYSHISSDKQKAALAKEIEKSIYDYFASLELPDYPTLYDHLLLSLREKDVIATFNWDPFLWKACERNYMHANLPHVLFLHGNVAVGHCVTHKQKGPVTSYCPVCRKLLTPSKLLYPITQKNYNRHPFIQAEWQTLRAALKTAYVFTIFGYGAPISDVEAMALMKEAWGPATARQYEEIEFIDIKNENELIKTWEPFIHNHHYRPYSPSQSFYESTVAHYPRRSCEALWAELMENKWMDPPCKVPFQSNLLDWLSPLIEWEKIET